MLYYARPAERTSAERCRDAFYYRIQVSKKGADGKETIPPQYNIETESGVEIGPEEGMDHVTVDVKPVR
jgi:hypothetical protein